MATWPAGLQQLLNQESFSLQPEDTNIRTDMDYGPAKVRKRYTDAVEPITATINLFKNDYPLLYDFYKTTLNNGVTPFDYIHPITQAPIKMRFMKPPRYTPMGGLYWKVDMSFEILP